MGSPGGTVINERSDFVIYSFGRTKTEDEDMTDDGFAAFF